MEAFFKIIPLKKFRKTNKVSFYNVPIVENMKSIDLVIHEQFAHSPGEIKGFKRPWYYHPAQIDNLFVTFGQRTVDLYKLGQGKEILTFQVDPYSIKQIYYSDNGDIEKTKTLIHEPAILHWESEVFHRVTTGEKGSASVNLAIHLPEFDLKTNFNIYNIDIKNQTFQVLRQGFKDQM